MGESLKNVSPAGIAAATTLSVNAIQYAIQVQQGALTNSQFALNCIRDTIMISTGVGGAALGQVIIPVPLLGALIGNVVGSTLGGIVYQGSYQVVMEACVESGWTVFGLIEQDYSLPADLLERAGYQVLPIQRLELCTFNPQRFQIREMPIARLDIIPLRRGVIACNVVGYL